MLSPANGGYRMPAILCRAADKCKYGEPGRFTVIGHCEEGSGVAIRLRGEPVTLTGWDHFGTQGPDYLR